MGYHQVTLVSRINSGDLKGWRLRNSWGNEWGNCGYAFISDEVLMALEPEIWGCSYKASFEEKIELCERMTQL
jgi:C1A family cysteine protease